MHPFYPDQLLVVIVVYVLINSTVVAIYTRIARRKRANEAMKQKHS